MMTDPTRYDDALPRFAALVESTLGENAAVHNLFLRDASGRLTLVLTNEASGRAHSTLAKKAETLSPYVEVGQAIATPAELFDPALADPDIGVFEYVDHTAFSGFVRVVERRVVGQDWLQPPSEPIAKAPPVFVFASHKGGVGRSTALAVASAALAERGRNVLVLDLDLEAPGLGQMFGPNSELPKMGTLDYFVESTFGRVDDAFLEDMTGVSILTQGRGSVHFAPAVGLVGEANPQNIVGKIARAYLETTSDDGTTISFLDRTRELVYRLSQRARYEAVFVDSRAGLNEATAAAVLGLGADILLFGVDSPQTFSGYRYFLSYLKRFRPTESGDVDWRSRLRMVQAKAPANSKGQADFRTRTFDLFADTVYDLEEQLEDISFNFNYDETIAPHFAWPILNDSNYIEFDPLSHPAQLSKPVYERTFGEFLNGLFDRLGLEKHD